MRAKTYRQYVTAFLCTSLVISLLGVALWLPRGMRQADQSLVVRATTADTAIQNYVDEHQTLPASLAEARVKTNPSDHMVYSIKSDTSYNLCATFKHASSQGYDWEVHKAGKNCRSSDPYFEPVKPLGSASDGKTTVCKIPVDYYIGYGPFVGSRDSSVMFNNSPDATNVKMLQINMSRIPGNAGVNTYMYGPDSIIYDQTCKKITPLDLKSGQTVSVYDKVYADHGSASIFLVQ